MTKNVGIFSDLVDLIGELHDLMDTAISIFSGDSVVIDEGVRARIVGETAAYKDLKLSPISDDPLSGGFSIGELLGHSSERSLDAITKFERSYLDFKHSVEVRQNELEALQAISDADATEADALYEQIRKVDEMLPKVSSFLKELPYWWADAWEIHRLMGERAGALGEVVRAAKVELRQAEERLRELEEWIKSVESWGDYLEDKLVDEDRQRRFQEIYGELKDRSGGEGSDIIRKQLAAILASVSASNSQVIERAERLRDDAERRRLSNVGPDMLDLLEQLVSLGGLTSDKSSAGKNQTKIEIRYERKEYHYYIPKSRKKSGAVMKKRT